MRRIDLSGVDQLAALSRSHLSRGRANLLRPEKSSHRRRFNFSQNGSRDNRGGKCMSWEPGTANEEFQNVDALESGLPFTANTEDTNLGTWWDSTAAPKIAKRCYDVFFSTLGLI